MVTTKTGSTVPIASGECEYRLGFAGIVNGGAGPSLTVHHS
jgi:hypothetical protein